MTEFKPEQLEGLVLLSITARCLHSGEFTNSFTTKLDLSCSFTVNAGLSLSHLLLSVYLGSTDSPGFVAFIAAAAAASGTGESIQGSSGGGPNQQAGTPNRDT